MRYFKFFLFIAFSTTCLRAEVLVADSSSHSQSGIEYQVEWPEVLSDEIRKRIESISMLLEHKTRLPGSFGGLAKRIEKDKELLIKTLHSFGYYGCTVSVDVEQIESPVLIKFRVELGPIYIIEDIRLESSGSVLIASLPGEISELIGLNKGEPLIAEKAQQCLVVLKKFFLQTGYPFVEINEPEGVINHLKHTVVLYFPVNLGGKAIISKSEVVPTENLNPDFIRNRLFWKNGDVFDSRIVERTRRLLTQSGLFENVVVTPKPITETETENNKEQPIVMQVKTTEAPPRSVSAGLHYATSQGGEARFAWNHYNLLGNGEHLGASLRVSQVRSKARIFYDIPDLGAPKQTLKNDLYVMRENTRAYAGKTFAATTKIERQLDEMLKASIGLSAEEGHIRQKTTNKRKLISLIGVPIELALDGSNDLLNPTRGFRIGGHITPYMGYLASSKGMIIGQGSASLYLPFQTNTLDEDMGTLASFIKFGTIRIRNFSDLPPNKRFYGGGNGSIRAYGYQLISPVDENRTPLGGESLLEFGTELRYRFTEKMGGVIFVEAGTVTQRKLPTFKTKLLWGTGFGIRYYTDYAPVRLDIAFPLQRRKIPGAKRPYDAPYQFYVSVGQAF